MTSSPSSNRRMPRAKPASVRFSNCCSTRILASRCTVDFGIAVRDASSASVSSGSSALKQSSSVKTRTRTDLGATWAGLYPYRCDHPSVYDVRVRVACPI